MKNEEFFREVNTQIDGLATHTPTTRLQIVCECGDDNCMRLIEIDSSAYQAVRRHDERFIVVRGHELPAYETVVAEADEHVVLEKIASPT